MVTEQVPALKRGDNIGYNGHKHMKGDKIIALCDRQCNIVAPFITAPGNKNECPLLKSALQPLLSMVKEVGFKIKESVMSLDGVYDSRNNRKVIFNIGMIPNINENKRNRKSTKRGRKKLFNPEIFQELSNYRKSIRLGRQV